MIDIPHLLLVGLAVCHVGPIEEFADKCRCQEHRREQHHDDQLVSRLTAVDDGRLGLDTTMVYNRNGLVSDCLVHHNMELQIVHLITNSDCLVH